MLHRLGRAARLLLGLALPVWPLQLAPRSWLTGCVTEMEKHAADGALALPVRDQQALAGVDLLRTPHQVQSLLGTERPNDMADLPAWPWLRLAQPGGDLGSDGSVIG